MLCVHVLTSCHVVLLQAFLYKQIVLGIKTFETEFPNVVFGRTGEFT